MNFENARLSRAVDDLVQGSIKRSVWGRLAWYSVRDKYRRSVLGPLWITLSTFVMVITFGVLYGRLLDEDLSNHLPYVACGIVIWMYFSEGIVQGCRVFISQGRLIQQIALPLSTHIYHFVFREFIVFCHNAIIIVLIFVFFQRSVSVIALYSVLGLILISVIVISTTLFLGVVSLRFRDVPMIIQSLMRQMMFITPVIWNASSRPGRAWLAEWNPFYHIVEVFRAPLLGQIPALLSWGVATAMAIVSSMAALGLFAAYRHRVAYWV